MITEEQKNRKIYIFDLDDTLAKSKQAVDFEMKNLLSLLLLQKKVAIISGAMFSQFEKQLLLGFDNGEEILQNLYILPTNGTQFFYYKNEWKRKYNEDLSKSEKKKIFASFEELFKKINFTPNPNDVYGVLVEDRGSQISFSGLGSQSPFDLKVKWDPDQKKRIEMRNILLPLLPDFEVKIGGLTSIDITKKGIDKAYGVSKIMKELDIKKEEITYIGDALFPGGNDESVKLFGVDCIAVKNPEDTKKIISEIIGR